MIQENDPQNQGVIKNAIEILTLMPANNAAQEIVVSLFESRTNAIHLYKADPLTSNREIKDVRIEIRRKLPDVNDTSLPQASALYDRDAEVLVSVLTDSLPQGTRYRVAMMLLAQIAQENLYRGV